MAVALLIDKYLGSLPEQEKKKKLKQTQIEVPVRLLVEHSGKVFYGIGSFTLVQSHRRSYLAR